MADGDYWPYDPYPKKLIPNYGSDVEDYKERLIKGSLLESSLDLELNFKRYGRILENKKIWKWNIHTWMRLKWRLQCR